MYQRNHQTLHIKRKIRIQYLCNNLIYHITRECDCQCFLKSFLRIFKKGLTFALSSAIMIKQSVGTHGRICRNGGIGRRPGLKIPWDFFSYRFDPGFRHHYIAEWSSLAARRAHNPKVMRFKSHLRNQRLTKWWAFFFAFGKKVAMMGLWTSRATLYDLSTQATCRVLSGSNIA